MLPEVDMVEVFYTGSKSLHEPIFVMLNQCNLINETNIVLPFVEVGRGVGRGVAGEARRLPLSHLQGVVRDAKVHGRGVCTIKKQMLCAPFSKVSLR